MKTYFIMDDEQQEKTGKYYLQEASSIKNIDFDILIGIGNEYYEDSTFYDYTNSDMEFIEGQAKSIPDNLNLIKKSIEIAEKDENHEIAKEFKKFLKKSKCQKILNLYYSKSNELGDLIKKRVSFFQNLDSRIKKSGLN